MIQDCFEDNGKVNLKLKVKDISGWGTVHGQACLIGKAICSLKNNMQTMIHVSNVVSFIADNS